MPRNRIVLGPLEIAVLGRLWDAGDGDVAAVHAAVGAPRGLARNTIHSTLERLVRKGLAARRRRGRSYVYEARLSRSEWLGEVLGELIERVPGVDAPLLVSTFVDLAERAGSATLDELELRVRARRRGRAEET